MSLFNRNPDYVVCPFCGHCHGDAWEWCKSEDANRMNCDNCGQEFLYWAEYDVQYVTKRPDPETTEKLRALLLSMRTG